MPIIVQMEMIIFLRNCIMSSVGGSRLSTHLMIQPITRNLMVAKIKHATSPIIKPISLPPKKLFPVLAASPENILSKLLQNITSYLVIVRNGLILHALHNMCQANGIYDP